MMKLKLTRLTFRKRLFIVVEGRVSSSDIFYRKKTNKQNKKKSYV